MLSGFRMLGGRWYRFGRAAGALCASAGSVCAAVAVGASVRGWDCFGRCGVLRLGGDLAAVISAGLLGSLSGLLLLSGWFSLCGALSWLLLPLVLSLSATRCGGLIGSAAVACRLPPWLLGRCPLLAVLGSGSAVACGRSLRLLSVRSASGAVAAGSAPAAVGSGLVCRRRCLCSVRSASRSPDLLAALSALRGCGLAVPVLGVVLSRLRVVSAVVGCGGRCARRGWCCGLPLLVLWCAASAVIGCGDWLPRLSTRRRLLSPR